MAWAYGDKGAWAQGSDTATLNVPFPSGITAGQLLVVIGASRYGATVNLPSGWTNLVTYNNGVRLAAKIADGTETGNLAMTCTGGNTDRFFGQMARFTGAPSAVSGNVAATNSRYTDTTTDLYMPSLDVTSPTHDGCLVLIGGIRSLNITTLTAPANFTEIDEVANSSGNTSCVAWGYWIQTTATDLGTSVFFDSASTDATGYHLAVAAAILPGTTTKHVKLLAISSAASAANVEGVVLNAARDTVIGEFTGQAFEAALEGSPGEAVLLIPVADITPDGSTLTTSDTPIVFAYNATDGTVGEGSATVVEV